MSGSVPDPVKMPPSASAAQMTAAARTARITAARAAGGGSHTPAAMTPSVTASTMDAARPCWPASAPSCRSRPVSQPGWPAAIAEIMLPIPRDARTAGWSERQARPPHKASHSARATGVPTERPAANADGRSAATGHSRIASSA